MKTITSTIRIPADIGHFLIGITVRLSLPLLFFALSVSAMAQSLPQVVQTGVACAGTLQSNFSCTSNDIKINSVDQLDPSEDNRADPVVMSCTEGLTIPGGIDIKLTTQLNANARYDVLTWFGEKGNNPKDPTTAPDATCYVSSLPDDPFSDFILDIESGADACNDVNSSPNPVVQYFFDVPVLCQDQFSVDPNGKNPDDVLAIPDGEADVFAFVSWFQNNTLNCGIETGQALKPGLKPKCDAAILLGININVIQNPGLMLTKSGTVDDSVVAPTGVANPGDEINYAFTLMNTGDVTVSDITLADTAGGVTVSGGPIAALAVNATDTTTFTASYTLNQSDIDSGMKSNTATATGDSPGGGPDDVSAMDIELVNIAQINSLTLTKGATPSTYVTVGMTISYTYDLLNSGNTTLTGAASVSDDKATVTCPVITSLAPGATVQCTASYTIIQADIDGGSVTNVALGSVGAQNSSQQMKTVTAIQNNSLSLTKGASPSTYNTVGATISYTYDLLNSGNTTLTGAASVTDDKATVSCPEISSLVPGATVQCTASYTITQGDIDGGSVTNTATGSVGAQNSNQDMETVNAVQTSGLNLAKGASPTTYDSVGATISYTYDLMNSGNTTILGAASVIDNNASVTCPVISSLAPGATVQCTASYTIIQADIDRGSVTNTATGSVGSTNSNQDMEIVTAIQNDSVSLTKTALPATYDTVGTTISYTYDMQNSGNTTRVGGASVVDDKATVTCPVITTLAPGAMVQCSASYTITQADIDGGSVTNTATGTVGGVASNEDTETVNAIQNVAIELVKSGTFANDGNGDGFADAGETLNYVFTVTNSGNVTLSNIGIVDNVGGITVLGGPLNLLAPTASDNSTFTAIYSLTQTDVNNGFFANLATVTGSPTVVAANAVPNQLGFAAKSVVAVGEVQATATETVTFARRQDPAISVPGLSKQAMVLLALLLLIAGWILRPAAVASRE